MTWTLVGDARWTSLLVHDTAAETETIVRARRTYNKAVYDWFQIGK